MSHPSNLPEGDTPESTPSEPTYGQQPPSYGASQPSHDPYRSSQPGQDQGTPAYGQPAYPPPAYGQAAYGQAGYGYNEPAPAPKTNGLAIAALVLGILALILCWFPIVGGVLALAALILGIFGVRRKPPSGKGMAITGIVLGAIALVVNIFFTIGALFLIDNVQQCQDDLGTSSGPAFEQCVLDSSGS